MISQSTRLDSTRLATQFSFATHLNLSPVTYCAFATMQVYRQKGGNEAIMRSGGKVVRRYTKKSAAGPPFLAAPVEISINKSTSRTMRWRRNIHWRAKSLSTRVLTISVGILFIVKWTRYCHSMLWREVHGSDIIVQPKPLMLQAPTLTNVIRLKVEENPPHLIEDRRNRYWINHGSHIYRPAPKDN